MKKILISVLVATLIFLSISLYAQDSIVKQEVRKCFKQSLEYALSVMENPHNIDPESATLKEFYLFHIGAIIIASKYERDTSNLATIMEFVANDFFWNKYYDYFPALKTYKAKLLRMSIELVFIRNPTRTLASYYKYYKTCNKLDNKVNDPADKLLIDIYKSILNYISISSKLKY